VWKNVCSLFAQKERDPERHNRNPLHWLTLIILAIQEAKIKRIAVGSQPGKIVPETLSRKYRIQKRTGRVTQVVEHLPSKHGHLSSNPNTAKINK
jgi:hypothetical protein